MNEQQPEIKPGQEAIDAATKRKIESIWLNGKLKGKRMEIYSRITDFFNQLKEKYPEEKMEDYLLYHLIIKSSKTKTEDCHGNNSSLVNEIVGFVDDLYKEYEGEEQK